MVTLIVVQGALATGKTTLSRRLSHDLELGVIAKDDIKEMLFERLGTPIDRDQSRVYGHAATDALYAMSAQLVRSGISHIIESAFHPQFANNDVANLVKGQLVNVVQVYCTATPDTMLTRYQKRINDGSRHAGHGDIIEGRGIDFFAEQLEFYSQLAIIPTIQFDSTQPDERHYRQLVEQLKNIMKGD